MSSHHLNKRFSYPVGVSNQRRTVRPRRIVNSMAGYRRVPRRGIECRVHRSIDAPTSHATSHLGGLIFLLTVASVVIGTLKGGWTFAVILASIALVESLGIVRHAASRQRPMN